MRRLAVILFSLSFLLIQLRYSIVQADYWVNFDEIVSTLCVERDIPTSTCAGKCHLNKQISELDEARGDDGQESCTVPFEELRFIATEALVDEMTQWYSVIDNEVLSQDSGLSDGWHRLFVPPPDVSVSFS